MAKVEVYWCEAFAPPDVLGEIRLENLCTNGRFEQCKFYEARQKSGQPLSLDESFAC